MGGLISSVWGKLFKSNRTFNILILGLANAGKTTLLYQMYPSAHAGPWEKQWRPPRQSAAMSKRSPTRT
jgi:stage III sporulation protein SpoIIIAA